MSTLEEKQEVLNCGLHILEAKYSRAVWEGDIERANSLAECLGLFPYSLRKVACQMINAKDQKQYRLVKRLKLMDNDAYNAKNKDLKIIFITLTFNNDALSRSNKQSRRDAVRKYLKSQCVDYVANIDYGAKNGREHYHAVALVNGSVDYSKWHNYGAIKGELVPTMFKDESKRHNRLAYYINKLSLHALKDCTLCLDRLVYCRKNDSYYTAILPF